MKVLAIYLVLILGQCLAQEPCKRLAEMVGEGIDFLKHDYYLGELTDWQMSRYIEEGIGEVKKHIGVDITSATEREEFICRAFRIKRLSEVYDFIESETSLDVTYQEVCREYNRAIQHYEEGYAPQLDIDFVKEMYGIAKDLANWVKTTGFPETFPPSISAETNRLLQGIVDKMDPNDRDKFYPIRGMLGDLLPLGPLTEWEVGYANRSTVEELSDWMRESNNIFTYAGMIKDNLDKWLSIRSFKISYAMLINVQHNYDKILWYMEAVKLFHKSNALTLDTSDCEEPRYTTPSYD